MTQSITILTDVAFIMLHFFVLLFSYQALGKKVAQPAVLFSLVWFVIILLHFICKFTLLNQLEPLRPSTYIIFLTGTIFFSAGSFLVQQYLNSKPVLQQASNHPTTGLQTSQLFRIASVLIILLGLPLYIRAAFQIFLASQAEDFFMGLRYELSYGDADIGPLKYLMPLAYVVFAFNLLAYFNKRSWLNAGLLLLTFLLVATYAVFSTGRTYFFMILSVYLGISFLTNPRFSIRRSVTSLVLFGLLFMLVGIIYGKGGNTDETVKDNIRSASEALGVYLVSGLNALDIETATPIREYAGGDNTFRFFIKAAMQLKLMPQRPIVDLKHEFVFVPYATNVYTYYSPYIADFGKLFAWLMLALYGAVHTWLYHIAATVKSKRSVFYYTFLLFPLFLSFFSDLYLTLFSFWLQLVFFTELLLYANKYFIAKKW
ncbi:MAG: hypothetical protein RL172_3357 [Bacteroidota bacterium]